MPSDLLIRRPDSTTKVPGVDPKRRLTSDRVVMRIVLVALAVAVIWAWRHIEMSFSGLIAGFGDVQNLLGRMLPPKFSDLDDAIRLGLETLWMAVIGTTIAVVLSFPIALGAARNTTPHPAVMAVCRGIIVLSRAVPDLIFAAIFVRALGIGVLPGVIALGLHSIGMIGKLFADAIEQTDRVPREAVVSVGATKWQAIVTSVIPQAMPSFISTVLYRLDINLRSSSVLGIVGAGGIGFLMQANLRSLQYDEALGVVTVIFVLITLMEFLSAAIRATLLGGERTLVGRSAPRFSVGARLFGRVRRDHVRKDRPAARVDPETVRPPWTGELRMKTLYGLAFLVLIVVAFRSVSLNPGELLGAFDDVWRVTTRLFPPDFTTARDSIIDGIIESVAAALVATFMGALISIPLGMMAARNVAVNRVVYGLSRIFLLFVRGVPDLIVAVIFIAAIGLGPVPGTLALAFGTSGFLAKLIADAVEEINPTPREATFAVGATRSQEIVTSVIPQAMPAIVSNLLYALDINLRTSTILGIVGGGGIGFILFNALRVLELRTVGAVLITIFTVVYVIELLAGWVRKQIL
ncbi:MAG: phosphonate transporter, permease protein PhnE [Actinomycetota bacterium]|jgi:phosphonate transport system permease protein